MKKLAAILLTAVITVCSVGILADDTVTVPAEIQWMKAVGLLTGDESGSLMLEQNVTRAEALALVLRAMGLDGVRYENTDKSVYPDVDGSHWAAGYIAHATEIGMLNGYPDGFFRPEDNVLYEEFLKMLIFALGNSAGEGGYPENCIKTALSLGINDGIDIKEGHILNRLQTAELLYNALKNEVVSTGITLKETYLAYAAVTDSRSSAYYDGGTASVEKSYEVSDCAEPSLSASGSSAGDSAYMPVIVPEEPYLYEEQFVPEPGQLTAGRWDDLRNKDNWSLLMSDREYHDLQSMWGISSEWYEIKVETDFGEPVWDASVTLYDGEYAVIWQSRTDKNGMAYVFAGQVGDNRQGNEFYVAVETSGGQTTEQQVQLSDQEAVTIAVSTEGEPEGLDLMFVIDTTGSMGDELQYIKEELKDVVLKIDVPVRLSCNFYRDFGDSYTVRPFPFETDVDTVVSQISAQRASGGGDYEEAVDMALIDAVNEHEWSDSSKARLLFLVLDAPPHYNDETVMNMQSITAEASRKGIRIIPVASSGVDKNTELLMRTMAVATNGTYIFLTDDSGIGDSHIDPSVGEYEIEFLNDLILSVIKEYIGQQ